MRKNWKEYNSKLLPVRCDDIHVDGLVSNIRMSIEKSDFKNSQNRILEVGCSNGRLVSYIGKKINMFETTGVDLYPCNSLGFQHPIMGDAFSLPFIDGAFDIVCSFGLIEHFSKDKKNLLIEEQSRVLKQGGLIVTTFPNCRLGTLRFLIIKTLDLFRDWKHNAITLDEVTLIMQKKQIVPMMSGYFGNTLVSLWPILNRTLFTSKKHPRLNRKLVSRQSIPLIADSCFIAGIKQ